MTDSDEFRRIAESIAIAAGSVIIRHLGQVKYISYKNRMNLVTDVDRKCDSLIVGKLKKAFPRHAVLSEESGRGGAGASPFCWIIDPLDGTTNYAHSFPFFSTSIALSKDGETVLGVVYDPLRNELFRAEKEKGAFLNNKRICCSTIRKLKRGLLVTGFPYRFGNSMRRNIENFGRLMMKAQAVRRVGSAALDLCYVACARFEGFWELDLHPWDTAAGALIVEEAKGRVSTFKGKRFSPFKKEIVASNSFIHNQILKVLR